MNEVSYQNQPSNVFSVTELSNALKMTVEETFSYVSVEGEISGLRIAASGHMYFKLKDESNLFNGIIWRGNATNLPCQLEEGMQIIAHGKISTYGARSEYQIIVNRVEQAGLGALMQRFEELKLKLTQEGLFAEERKQPLPLLPETIGIITSPTGAVIEDMKHRIADRFPRHILLYPTLVQGEGAKEQIAAGVEYFNQMDNPPEVIIVARGGGSLEDLWAFNEEIVVRAVAASTIPVISAVGHEVDFTLCDFAADLRAPTPSAAAELVVPVRKELIYNLQQRELRIQQAVTNLVRSRWRHLDLLQKSLPDLRTILSQVQQRVEERQQRLAQAMHSRMLLYKSQLSEYQKLVVSLSPQGILERGYSFTTDSNGQLVKSVKQLSSGDEVSIHYHDGAQEATIN